MIQGAKVLDLFAGSGAIGFEALSRGAAFATFVEQNKAATTCIRENAVLLNILSKTQILSTPVLTALPRLIGPYDLIYIDPPYDLDVSNIMKGLTTHNLLSPTTLIFLEERFEPKKPAPTFPSLTLIDTRRYGIAQLHQYVRIS
jgi:16S rRNA (guanine966-N2)-methyltransferase